VLSEGLAVRDDRRFRQGLRLSRFPHHKTPDVYDFAFRPDLNPREANDSRQKRNRRSLHPRPARSRPRPGPPRTR